MIETINPKKDVDNSIWLAQVKIEGEALGRLRPVVVWMEEDGICQVSIIQEKKPTGCNYKVIEASPSNGLANTTYLIDGAIMAIPTTNLVIHLGFL